mgnify:CR=1 FL=1
MTSNPEPLESHNQTQFSAEEPFYEEPVALPQTERVIKPVVPFFKRRKTIIVLIVGATAVLLVALFVINMIIEQNRRLGDPADVTVAPPAPMTTNALVQEVEQLRTEWKAADPSKIELQLPAVDLSIRLDDRER